jgi:hypothetical protein
LFGAATPLASRLDGSTSPQVLAGLLYLGSGLVLWASMWWWPARREAPLTRRELPALSGAIFFGGGLGPVLLVIGIVASVVCDQVGVRMPSPYREAWKELDKVQSHGKLGNIASVVVITVAIMSLLVCIPSVDTYTRITSQEISTNGFWSLGHEDFHPWSQVSKVIAHESYYINHGQTSKSITYELVFSNGKRWKVDDGNMGLLGSRDFDRAIKFIVEKSGREIEYSR